MKTTKTEQNNKSVVVEHYTKDDIENKAKTTLMTGSYTTNNFRVFDAIKNSDESLKTLSDVEIVAKALIETYNIENSLEELSTMLSRSYNSTDYQKVRLSEQQTAKADTSNTVKSVYTDEQFKQTIAKARSLKMSNSDIIAKFRSLFISDDVLKNYFTAKELKQKTEIATIF